MTTRTSDDGAIELPEVRALFPITQERSYLFAGALSPAAEPVRAAIDAWADAWTHDPISHREDYFVDWRVLRERFAELIGASSEEVAITDNTSRGLNIATQILELDSGANVVVDATTYPSAFYSWYLPAREDVEVRTVPSDGGLPQLEELERLVDSRTAAISVSHVCRVTGFRHDLASLAQLSHAHGAYLIVDGAQSVGAVAIDVGADGVDFLSCGAMKWLLGPPGIGFFYGRRDLVDSLPPPQVGPLGLVGGPHAAIERPPPYKPGAARHELGISDLVAAAGARAGVEIILDVGKDRVEDHVLRLSGYLIEGLFERGVDVATPAERARRGGVVSFRVERPEELRSFLRERRVDVWGYEDQRRMRADPHVYNNTADVDRLLAGLDEYVEAHGWEAVNGPGEFDTGRATSRG